MSPPDVVDINANKPHLNVLAMCVATRFDGIQYMTCFKRWIGTVPEGAPLTKLECPECNSQDSFASILPAAVS